MANFRPKSVLLIVLSRYCLLAREVLSYTISSFSDDSTLVLDKRNPIPASTKLAFNVHFSIVFRFTAANEAPQHFCQRP